MHFFFSSKGYAGDLVLLSPSIQYSSVCISVSRDTVLWKANLSSSPLKIDRLLASSCLSAGAKQIKRFVAFNVEHASSKTIQDGAGF